MWLWEEAHVRKVVGLNPSAVYWMDMTFFHMFCCKKLYCMFEKTENKQKEAGMAHFLKKEVAN